jgi:hypothetical protein
MKPFYRGRSRPYEIHRDCRDHCGLKPLSSSFSIPSGSFQIGTADHNVDESNDRRICRLSALYQLPVSKS